MNTFKSHLLLLCLLLSGLAQAQVDLVLSPAASTVTVGDNVTLTLEIVAGQSEYETIGSYLNFDPSLVTVNSVVYDADPQFDFEISDPSMFDPTGKIDGISTALGRTLTGTITYLTINLTTIAAGTATFDYSFVTTPTLRETDVLLAGTSVLGTASGATITIVDPVTNDPPVISVSEVIADLGDALSIPISISDEGSVTASISLFDKSAGGTNNPFTPSTEVPAADYTFTDNGSGSYTLDWTPTLARSYYAVVTADDGVNAAVSESFSIGVAQDLLAPAPGILARTFHNPLPWYGGNPQNGFTVAIENNAAMNIGWTDAGEFVEYIVDVPAAGTYDAEFFCGKGNNGPMTVTLSEEIGGGLSPIGSFDANQTGWQNYVSYPFEVTFTNPGVQVLRVAFSGSGGVNIRDFNFQAQAPNAPPTVSIDSPTDGDVVDEGDDVIISATASDSDGSITSVEFFDGATSLGTDTDAPYSATLTGITAGSHALTAVATDDNGATTTSTVVTITADAAPTQPVVTVGGPDNKQVAEGGSIVIPISISDQDGDNLTVSVTSVSDEPQLLQTFTNTGTQRDPSPTTAEGFLVVSNEVNAPGSYAADLTFTPTFGDGGGADGDGDGVYTVTIEVMDNGNTISTPFTLTVTDVAQQLSATNVVRIEAESFDNQGPANSNPNNTGDNNGIGVEVNPSGVTNIGYTHVGDFAEYLIDVPQAGNYDIAFQVAKGFGNTATMDVSVGQNGTVLGSINVDPTGDWQNYVTTTTSVTLPAGPQTLRFDWSGGSSFLFNIDYFDVEFAEDPAPVVSITTPADGDTFIEGTTVSVTVDATDDAAVTQVELFDGANSLGIDATAPYEFTIPNAMGTYVLTAVASDGTTSTTSAAVTITGVAPNTAPQVTITAPTDGSAVIRGSDLTLTGTVTDAEETGLAANLQWTSNDIQFSTDPIDGTGASITGQMVTPGSQTITASVTDAGGLSGSDMVTVIVSNPEVTITAPTQNATLASTDVRLEWTAEGVIYDLTEHFHIFVNPPDPNNIDTDTRISTASEIGQLFWDLDQADGIIEGTNLVVLRPANQFHQEFLSDPNDPNSFIEDAVTFTVNLPDDTAPVITLLGDNPLNVTQGDAYVEAGATAQDDTDGDISGDILIDASAVDVNTVGSYTVTYSVSDAAGNPATANRTVNVNAQVELPTACDNTLYRVNVGGPTQASADATPLDWSGDTGNFPNANNSPFLAAMSGGGSIYNGNANSAHPGPIIMSDASVPTSAPASIFNTERYDLEPAPEMKWEFPVAPGTEVQVTLLFAELFGSINAAGQRVFDVAIEGNVLPAFDNIDPIAIAGPKGAFTRSATLVITDGTLDIEFLHVTENPALKGIQICGITSPPDNTPPVITLLGDNPTELTVGDTYTDAGATASDDQDGDITADIVVGGDVVNTSAAGTYVVTYNVSDEAGNPATEVTRTVIVSPTNTAPVITLLGDNPLALTVGDTYTEPGASADDNEDGDITADIVIGGDVVNTSAAGTYVVTYNVTDSDGNPAVEVSRTVDVTEADFACAYVAIDPNGSLVSASTFSNGMIITNNSRGNVNITSVSFDLSTAIYPNMVFDPVGTAGDATAKCLTISSQTGGDGNVGLTIPGNGGSGSDPDCTAPFAGEAEVGNGGYSVLNVNFTDFEPGETINFAIDIDPTSIEGFNSAGNAGAIGGLELTGSTVTVELSNGQTVTTLAGELFRIQPNDVNGSENFFYAGNETAAPSLDVVGATGATTVAGFVDATVGGEAQIVRITGNPGDNVSLLVLESSIEDLGPGVTPGAFEANKAQTVEQYDAQIGPAGTVDIPVVLADNASGEIYHLVATANRTAADGCGAGTTNTSDVWRLKVEPIFGLPNVKIEVLPGTNLNASTFGGNGNFQITNQSTGNLQVTGVSFDLSTGILPDMVFDPTGTGGDATAQCFTAGSTAAAVGLVAPSDDCVSPFSAPRNGGFDVLSTSFTDFDPNESFTFSVDVDPNSIQGIPGAGGSGAVSGYELIGATLTVTLSDGSTIVGNLYEDGSLGGAQAIITGQEPTAPSISVMGLATTPATVSDLNQTITVAGTPGDNVSLLVMDSRLFIATGAAPFGVSDVTYYANEAMSGKALYTGVIGTGGTLDVPVVLLATPSGNTTPDGGLNQIIAVTSATPYAVDQPVSGTSNVITLLYDPNSGPDADEDGVPDANDNCPAVANADQLNTDGDAEGDVCDDDDDNDGVPDAEDCDPLDDQVGLPTLYYADADNDGFGDEATATMLCEPTPGFVTVAGDCDDTDPAINPDATEVCDGVDNNCDGQIDEGLTCNPGATTSYTLEAECAVVGSAWVTVNDAAASNGQYTVRVGDNANAAPPADVPASRVRFNLDDAEAGNYFFYARFDAPTRSDNSFWVRVNGGAWYRWNDNATVGLGFAWHELPTGTVTLTQGANVIDFAYRENGTKLDKLHVDKTPGAPTGAGEVATNCGPVMNQPPVAVANVTVTNSVEPGSVQLDGTASSDPDGTIASYSWSINGDIPVVGPMPAVVNLAAGSYTAVLTVTDNDGLTATSSVMFVIEPDADGDGVPDASDNCPNVANADQADSDGNGVGDACEPTNPGNNVFTLEAECAQVGSNFITEANSAASNGDIVFSNNGYSTGGPPPDVAANRVRFTVSGATAGSYNLYARSRGDNTSFDSYWVRVNGGQWVLWFYRTDDPSGLVWNEVTGSPVSLTAGVNTIDFAYREPNTWLDKIHLNQTGTMPSGVFTTGTNCDVTPPAGLTDFVLEAECAQVGSNFVTTTNTAASNGSIVFGNNGYSTRSAPADVPANRIRFTVEGAEAGDFNLYARSRGDNTSFDSFWVRVNGGQWVLFFYRTDDPSGLVWNEVTGSPVTLTGGTNTIDFAYREPNTWLDKIALNKTATMPTGTGTPGTNCDMAPNTDESFTLEAECAQVGASFATVASGAASNGSYVFGNTSNSLRNAPSDIPANRVRFNVNATNAGNFNMYARVRGDGASFDSFWVRVNGGQWVLWFYRATDPSGFVWTDVSSTVPVSLTAGANTIDFAYREARTWLDKIHVSNFGGIPTGMGDAATNCTSALAKSDVTTTKPKQPATADADQASTPLEQVSMGDLSVYPNPTVEFLNFAVDNVYEGPVAAYVFSVNGGLVSRAEFSKHAGQFTGRIETSDLPAGTYLLRLVSDTEVQQAKFIKVVR